MPDDLLADRAGISVGALLERARNGDAQAWDALVGEFTNLLWSVGRAHRLDTAAVCDVIQTTWLRLLENLSSIRDPDRLPGWLATTARRECLAELRKTAREGPSWESEDSAEAVVDPTPGLDHLLLIEERDAVLWRSFEQLSQRCRTLLRILVAVPPPSYAEVSAAIGVPIGSIGPTRIRCLGRLREIVAESGYPFDLALGAD